MKTTIISIIVLLTTSISFTQNVEIPDNAFLNALIAEGVDSNGDGLISYAEAKAVTNLDVGIKKIKITDMTGIEAFVNLETLYCWDNNLTSLDVSNNTVLTKLGCGNNQLTSLDVSKNIELFDLDCSQNQLTSLDVSNNAALVLLYCSENQLTSLDVTNNIALGGLLCNDNQLTNLDVTNCTRLAGLSCGGNLITSLDISNNQQLFTIGWFFSGLSISNMPSLCEVCVWEDFNIADVVTRMENNPNAYFTTDCSTTGITDYQDNYNFTLYPNPAEDILYLETDNINNATIEIYTVTGKKIYSRKFESNYEEIDVSDFSKGIYLIKVQQAEEVYVGKVVVK